MRNPPRRSSLFLVTLLLLAVPGTAEESPSGADGLDLALERAGMTRELLGWTPRGWWSRWPRNVPYELDHFGDLFAEPLATVTFLRTMGSAARQFLAPEALALADPEVPSPLYQLLYAVGVDRKTGGFRPYSANLIATPVPLDEAILELYSYAGRATRFVSFGKDSPYPLLAKELHDRVAVMPAPVSLALGRLVREAVEVHRWAELAFRRVPLEARQAIATRFDVGMQSVDALEYPWVCDDVARDWDEASLWYAGLRAAAALDAARHELAKVVAKQAPAFAFDWETPLGWIRVRGSGKDEIDGNDAFLIVDLGGNDRYTGGVAASSATRSVGLCLDLGGDDQYECGRAALGAGLCGIGMLLDAHGNDTYAAGDYSQGVGQFGLGAIFDLAGKDQYRAGHSAQGTGYFGIGLLADAAGDDTYYLLADGQGFGGVAGVGVLADRSGNDRYVAEPDPVKSGRPSYHSDMTVSVSNAQGCAMGRRGDGADGHSWAGGLGALLDVEGNDDYLSGNWSQGTGYWFGTGLLYEGAGDDVYHGSVWSQGAGAHFCIGALLDEAGNDKHLLERTSRSGLAFGHDFTIALLIDLGGNDLYHTDGDGLAFSINRSVAILIDSGGDDVYETAPENPPGTARYDKRFEDQSDLSTYFADASSVAIFLDQGGKDRYTSPRAVDGSSWGDHAPLLGESPSENWRARNPGVGLDLPGGTLDLRPQPVRGRQRPQSSK